MNDLLTVAQAAERLQLNPDTVRKHLRDGVLRGVRVGGQWRIPADTLGMPPTREITRRRQPAGRLGRIARELNDADAA